MLSFEAFEQLQKDVEGLKKQNQRILEVLEKISPQDGGVIFNNSAVKESKKFEEKNSLPEISGGNDFDLAGNIVEKNTEIKDEAPTLSTVKEILNKEAEPEVKKEYGDLEKQIGAKIFSRVGIVALVIGIGFFVKYVNDNNLISYLGRILIGVGAGLALVVLGEVSSRFEKFASWGKILVGGGLAAVYFCVYASYGFENYRAAIGMSQSLNVFLLILVAFGTIFFSIKDDSQIIAGEAFLLGLITCLLNNDYGIMVLVYNLILTIALVVVSAYKKWPVIGIAGVFGTYLTYFVWRMHNPSENGMAISFLSIFFLSYVLQSLFFSSKMQTDDSLEKKIVAANVLNSLLFFLGGFFVAQEWKGDWDAIFCLLLGIFHFVAAFGSAILNKKITSQIYFYFGFAFHVLAVMLWLDKELITVGWSAITVIMLLAWLKTRYKPMEYCAHALAVLMFGKVLLFDSSLRAFDSTAIFESSRLIAYSTAIVCLFISYALLTYNREKISQFFSDFITKAYAFGATGLSIAFIFIEFNNDKNNLIAIWLLSVFLVVAFLPYFKKFSDFFWHGSLVGVIIILKVFSDLFTSTGNLPQNHLLIYILTIVILGGAYIFWLVNKNRLDEKNLYLPDIYHWMAVIVAFFVIAIELDGYWVSVDWAILGLALIILGFYFRNKNARYQGLLIFSFTILKVFLYDTQQLESIYRTISYMSLGGILLGSSFLYNKYKDKIIG